MKAWFDTLRFGAIVLFLLGTGGWMVVVGFERGAEFEEFRMNGEPVTGRVVLLRSTKDFLIRNHYSAEVEYRDGGAVKRGSVDLFRQGFDELSEGGPIELLVSRRDRERVGAASKFENEPISIGGVRVHPIGVVALLNFGLGGFLAWMMAQPWLEVARTKARRRRKAERGRASSAPVPRLVVDSKAGLPDGSELRALVSSRDWPALTRWMSALDRGRIRVIEDLVDSEGFPEWLDEWAAAEPESAMPWLVRGIRRTGWAWEARTANRAEDVDPKAWPVFYERLEEAEGDLAQAAALDPGDARPWIRLISVAKGLSMPLTERFALLEEADRRAPHSFDAHATYLDAIAEKWGGSHQAALAHARRIAEEAPASSGLASLLADVHFEIAATCESMEGYFELPEVGEELRRAAELCQAVRAPWLKRRAAASLAFCFWQAGLLEDARRQFLRAEAHVCGIWASYREPAALYEQAWKECA